MNETFANNACGFSGVGPSFAVYCFSGRKAGKDINLNNHSSSGPANSTI